MVETTCSRDFSIRSMSPTAESRSSEVMPVWFARASSTMIVSETCTTRGPLATQRTEPATTMDLLLASSADRLDEQSDNNLRRMHAHRVEKRAMLRPVNVAQAALSEVLR